MSHVFFGLNFCGKLVARAWFEWLDTVLGSFEPWDHIENYRVEIRMISTISNSLAP
jgi:hypothetical protein